MPDIAIIADDLTGALDAAAPFAGRARKVTVATSPVALDAALASGAAVVAVSTRSREIGADAARAQVAGVMARLPAGVTVFKKIDSRLKGHIAAELDAMGGGAVLVCPAIPDLDRHVRDGAVAGAGVTVPIPVAPALGVHAARAVVPDVQRQDDLDRALAEFGAGLLVGARGLAQALAARRYGGAGAPWSGALPDPATLVVGSTDPVTLAQLAQLRAVRPGMSLIAAPNGIVPNKDQRPADLTVIQAVPGAGPRADARTVAMRFAAGAAGLLGQSKTILVTGGATAEAVFDALGVGCLDVAGEVLPGLPVCHWRDRVLVTKSGGFGAPDALCRLFPATEGADCR